MVSLSHFPGSLGFMVELAPSFPRIIRAPYRRAIRIACAALALVTVLAPSLHAERRPRTPEELVSMAEVIVVGRITDLKFTMARSETVDYIGNYDLLVDVTLDPSRIEKGEFPQGVPVVARGFRSQSRLSLTGRIGLGGHRPIPPVGTEVRAHLVEARGGWSILYPNGLVAVDSGVRLDDAPEITAQRRRPFTLWLPIEHWIVITVVGLIGVGVIRLLRRDAASRQKPPRSSPTAP